MTRPIGFSRIVPGELSRMPYQSAFKRPRLKFLIPIPGLVRIPVKLSSTLDSTRPKGWPRNFRLSAIRRIPCPQTKQPPPRVWSKRKMYGVGSSCGDRTNGGRHMTKVPEHYDKRNALLCIAVGIPKEIRGMSHACWTLCFGLPLRSADGHLALGRSICVGLISNTL
jgi:hypothetical protein